MGQYGIALFILTPIFLGAAPIVWYGQHPKSSIKWTLGFALQTLGVFLLMLILFAVEGLICILMAAPIAIFFSLISSLIAHTFVARKAQSRIALMLLSISILGTSATENPGNTADEISSVTTRIEIAASPTDVWTQVIAFPEIPAPTELFFRAGIAYPTSAVIVGEGNNAIRYCKFTTGAFVEPITIWDMPKHLAFSVAQQPAPMTELSFWNINAPHLHDYFASQRGEFVLEALPNGHTQLSGTTWYKHRIAPAIYWKLWSNYLVHKIHYRVLKHIKHNAEAAIASPDKSE
jgi:hypothetical protein